MKNLVIFSSLAVITAAAFTGCTKAAKTTTPNYLSATAGSGGSFYSTGALLAATENMSSPYPYLNIKGNESSGSSFGFWIGSYTSAVGAYPIDGVHAGASYNPFPTGAGGAAAYGTLTLTAVSPDIVGTIHFTCVDSTVISGSFDVVAP